jgi:hypothetical protein
MRLQPDLAWRPGGDRPAEAERAACSDGIPRRIERPARRLPARSARQAAPRRKLFAPVIAQLDQRDRNRSGNVFPCHWKPSPRPMLPSAWCLSQAGGCAMSAALSGPAGGAGDLGDPRAVLAWGPGPRVRAVECEGGYRVTGALVPLHRRPACDLARGALPDLLCRRVSQMRRQGHSARANHAGPHRGR